MTGTTSAPIYERLGLRTFINARGTITTLGGSIMPPEVVAAMSEASLSFVRLEELHDRVGERIAALTGAEAAFVCAGAASGMLLAGAACLTGTDPAAIAALPDTGGRPNRFVISLVDSHSYVHQGFRVCGGELVRVGSREAVSAADYEAALDESTAAVVFFLGSQPLEQLREIVPIARRRGVPVIVDAAAQLPPRSNLTDLTTGDRRRPGRLQRRQGPLRAAVERADPRPRRPREGGLHEQQSALGGGTGDEGGQGGGGGPAAGGGALPGGRRGGRDRRVGAALPGGGGGGRGDRRGRGGVRPALQEPLSARQPHRAPALRRPRAGPRARR